MKIRKTTINEQLTNIFIYENKKEELFVVAIPIIEWSTTFTYDDAGDTLVEALTSSLAKRVGTEEAGALAMRVYQWTREI
jgi:hypothetical protein